MKTIKTFLVFGLAIGIISSCNKKDDDTSSSPSNADLNGDYLGDITIKYTLKADGSTVDYNDDSVGVNANGSGTSYLITIDNSDPSGEDNTSTVKVSGKKFSSTTGTELFLEGVNGSLDGNTITFGFSGDDGQYSWIGDYTGVRPGSGGGGGNGFAGPAEYNTGSVNVTANGQQFTLAEADGGIINGDFSMTAGDTSPAQNGELELYAKGISGPGTYSIVAYTWDEDRNTWDTIEATISNALTVASVSETSMSGSFSFTNSGLTISGTFTLNK